MMQPINIITIIAIVVGVLTFKIFFLNLVVFYPVTVATWGQVTPPSTTYLPEIIHPKTNRQSNQVSPVENGKPGKIPGSPGLWRARKVWLVLWGLRNYWYFHHYRHFHYNQNFQMCISLHLLISPLSPSKGGWVQYSLSQIASNCWSLFHFISIVFAFSIRDPYV